jgi:hypothetical protein
VSNFIENLADTYRNNKSAFLFGFFSSVILCLVILLNDPDSPKVKDYAKKWDDREIRDLDKPMGYERTVEKRKEREPKLYEA